MPKVSLVIPSYNEELMIEKTEKTLRERLEAEAIAYEIVFVADGSGDSTWLKVEELYQGDARIVGVHFSRNFGKESAILAGLANARGDCCLVMDCDLQHPPQTAIAMYRLWEEGYEVIEGIKQNRGNESHLHRFSAGIFNGLMSSAMGSDMFGTSDFKLLDRKAVDALLAMPEKNSFFRALSSWIGFRTTRIEFCVQEREAGRTKWSTASLIRYALTNIVAFSTLPMQCVTVAGVFVFLLGIILGIQTLANFFAGRAVEGFTTVILLLLLIGSTIMISLGIIGYYISKIYEEVKGRPRYIISQTIRREEG